MNDRTTTHHTLVIERTYDAAVPRVFAAWSDEKAMARWYVPGDGTWTLDIKEHDFRVGGRHFMTFGPRGGDVYSEDCRFEDIVDERRICYAMTVATGDVRTTTSMVTVEFFARGPRTEVKVTEQLTILDGGDRPEDRKRGWGETLDKLPTAL